MQLNNQWPQFFFFFFQMENPSTLSTPPFFPLLLVSHPAPYSTTPHLASAPPLLTFSFSLKSILHWTLKMDAQRRVVQCNPRCSAAWEKWCVYVHAANSWNVEFCTGLHLPKVLKETLSLPSVELSAMRGCFFFSFWEMRAINMTCIWTACSISCLCFGKGCNMQYIKEQKKKDDIISIANDSNSYQLSITALFLS